MPTLPSSCFFFFWFNLSLCYQFLPVLSCCCCPGQGEVLSDFLWGLRQWFPDEDLANTQLCQQHLTVSLWHGSNMWSWLPRPAPACPLCPRLTPCHQTWMSPNCTTFLCHKCLLDSNWIEICQRWRVVILGLLSTLSLCSHICNSKDTMEEFRVFSYKRNWNILSINNKNLASTELFVFNVWNFYWVWSLWYWVHFYVYYWF